jgi:hypothetical protein
LPDKAPELYAERKERSENPIDFMHRVWGKWLSAGVLYQDQLRKLDDTLVPVLRSFCKRNKISADKVMPPPRSKRTEKILGVDKNPDAAIYLKKLRQSALHRMSKK